jgi:hypothetical protein
MARIGFKKSIKVMPKKRGRATGKDPQIVARMPAESIANVDAWAEANKTTRSAAFRRLVEIGLKAKRWAAEQWSHQHQHGSLTSLHANWVSKKR